MYQGEPEPVSRIEYYEVLGRVAANMMERLSGISSDSVKDVWGIAARTLAIADDMFEADQSCFQDGESALAYFGVDTTDPNLVRTANELIEASRSTRQAQSIGEHFKSRKTEAISTLHILRYLSPEAIAENTNLWHRLGNIVVAGTHLDSVLDAREDAKETNFSALSLRVGALFYFIGSATRIDWQSWKAIYSECKKQNPGDRSILKKLFLVATK